MWKKMSLVSALFGLLGGNAAASVGVNPLAASLNPQADSLMEFLSGQVAPSVGPSPTQPMQLPTPQVNARDEVLNARRFTPGDVGDPVAQGMTPYQKAFLNATAHGESRGRYDVRYTPTGGARFTEGDAHPNILEPGPEGPSSAAGRYQFTGSTWRDMGNLPFTRENQDMQAWRLAKRDFQRTTGKDLDLELQEKGLTPEVMKALSPTWTSFRKNTGQMQVYKDSLSKYSQSADAGNAQLEHKKSGEVVQFPISMQDSDKQRIISGARIDRGSIPVKDIKPIPLPGVQKKDAFGADGGGLSSFVSRWFGSPTEAPKEDLSVAPQMTQYPTDADVANARRYGADYGSGNEAYTSERTARVVGARDPKTGKVKTVPASILSKDPNVIAQALPIISTNADLERQPELMHPLARGDQMKAQLAVQRNPIAMLGYDPRRFTYNMREQDQAVEGLYTRGGDEGMVTPNSRGDASTIVHESIHRGLQMIRQANPELARRMRSIGDEEYLTRFLMQKFAGDPENLTGTSIQYVSGKPSEGQKQQDAARMLYDENTPTGKARLAILDDVWKEAQKMIAQRKPGGPR